MQKGNTIEILASEIKEGDTLRGYDLFTKSFTKNKVVSKITIMARKISLKTSLLDPVYISEDTYIASTAGIWGYRSSIVNVKLFRKASQTGQLQTPRPSTVKFEDLDLYVSVATASHTDTILVDNYLYVNKDWNGLKIKSMGSTSDAESMDAGSGTEPSSD